MSCVFVITVRKLLAIIGLVGASVISAPAGALSHEEWVMAFVRFVEWPAPSIAPDNTLLVCQPADAPPLDLQGRQVRGLTLQVVRITKPREMEHCHLFSALAQRESEWASWLSVAKSLPILVVGQGARYCEVGGAICLLKDAATGVEKYQLNLDTLSRAGFKVRSQLLRQPRARPIKNG
jgi:hypothetical protein